MFKINWNDRLTKCSNGQNVFVSIDGVDCIIFEPKPFDRKWYSFKHNGPGLRYEIGLCISTGKIVWAHGGKPCGAYTDLKMAREHFVSMLVNGEKAVADKGYKDNRYFITPTTHPNYPQINKILARHETINKRLKQWKCMSNRFRNSLNKHPQCFHAVINIVTLCLDNGEPLFDV